jgi:hypothetical protein
MRQALQLSETSEEKPSTDALSPVLRTLAELYEECGRMLAHSPYSLRQRVTGSRATGISLNEKAMAIRTETQNTLGSWARLVVDECGVTGPSQEGIRPLVSFLIRHSGWLAAHPAAGDFAEEIAALVRSARRIAGPGPAHRVDLGRCLRSGCAGTLRAVVHDGDDGRPGHVSCDAGHALPPQQWLLVAHRMRRTASRGERATRRHDGDRAGVREEAAR